MFFKLGDAPNPNRLRKNITNTVKAVATRLNNTANVRRKYYIHPKVFNTYTDRVLITLLYFTRIKNQA